MRKVNFIARYRMGGKHTQREWARLGSWCIPVTNIIYLYKRSIQVVNNRDYWDKVDFILSLDGVDLLFTVLLSKEEPFFLKNCFWERYILKMSIGV
tara:strand:- start:46 stop:333 length:288 start_codon:yes stop_codon:yes gene_type:complete